jgi:cyclic beta-1,2-glucan synthetase
MVSRGYYDDGRPLGSAQNDECRSIRSRSRGRCSRRRCRAASPSARWTRCGARLIDRQARLLQLLSPPFDKSDQDPGYIKGYPPASARTAANTRTPRCGR